jgi:hypothetical protein
VWFFVLSFKEKNGRWPLMKAPAPKPTAATSEQASPAATTQGSLQKTEADESVITEVR